MAKKQSDKIRPAEEIRIGGIKAALWRNESENGAWFNVTFQRLYRNAEGEWRSVTSFTGTDLLLLAKAANNAHSRMLQRLVEERASDQGARPAA